MKTGEWVGAGHWANRFSHPRDWGKPLLGRILDPADRRVWSNSFEFPVASPDGAAVMSLVLKQQAAGLLDDKVPIEWHFDNNLRIIRWELLVNLRTAKDEHIYYNAIKSQRLDEINHRRTKRRPLSEFLPNGSIHLAHA
ncbi:hypothetical protein ACUXAV_006425 [Cupriavidus metallidurans]|jgi:hypothetical protein|uniref:Uncharacterized protein n=1 Tax=Cupriavidus pauculus TaxID=82633 RepID=A0A3G8GVF1_9BURK|nr:MULTISPECIES: hypothetical protein [Cupriavidus]AZG12181.1 hypothetical protein EHF44_01570 [Cupriavidus pauculus]MCA3186700.1 hypothetical protein [Cupriavidus sp.]MCA3194158.1 hypothetical protein [Cupriavidus sp.]MCA3235689.1 hypothetical protein [Cupriavidus sp.]MDE4922508.1 hypothetical protein [Cupriavidus metallidurans]